MAAGQQWDLWGGHRSRRKENQLKGLERLATKAERHILFECRQ